MKKRAIFLGILALSFSSSANANINPADPQAHIFQHLQEIGVMSFEPNPDNLTSRAEALAIVLRVGGIKIPEYNGATFFEDVDPNSWYAPLVARAVETKVISAQNRSFFRPNEAITKAEFLAMLLRATNVNVNNYAHKTKDISLDVNSEDWFAPFFAYAKQFQIAHLPPDQMYQPNKALTRREVAMMTFRQERLFYGNSTTKIFAELQAQIEQFLTLLQAGEKEKAEMHLQRITELNDKLTTTQNNQEAVAATAISRALNHFSESLRYFQFQENLAALENLHLAAKQTQRAIEKSEALRPFSEQLALLINQTLMSFVQPQFRFTQK